MENRELRIGNLVMIENELLSETKGEVYKVSGVELKRIELFPDSDSTISLDHTESLRIYNQLNEFVIPIPLTDHWLDRFGFKYSHDTVHPNRVFRKTWDEGNFDLEEIVSYHFGGSFLDVEIKYVHQLQNLFYSLTGKELELTKQ